MKRWKSSGRFTTTALVAASVAAVGGGVFAQSVDDVLQAEQRRLELAQAAQEEVNQVVEGTRSLVDDYRSINKEIDGLRVYNRLMTARSRARKPLSRTSPCPWIRSTSSTARSSRSWSE